MQSGSFQHCERERREEGDIKIIEREREESFGCIGYKGAFIELVLTISFFLFFFSAGRRVSFVKLFRVCLIFLSRVSLTFRHARFVFRDVNFCAVEKKFSTVNPLPLKRNFSAYL